MAMNVDALVREVTGDTGFYKKDVEAVIHSALGAVVNSLENGQDVQLKGYIQLLVKDVPARDRTNPQTGAVIHKEAGHKVAVKLGTKIKNSVK